MFKLLRFLLLERMRQADVLQTLCVSMLTAFIVTTLGTVLFQKFQNRIFFSLTTIDKWHHVINTTTTTSIDMYIYHELWSHIASQYHSHWSYLICKVMRKLFKWFVFLKSQRNDTPTHILKCVAFYTWGLLYTHKFNRNTHTCGGYVSSYVWVAFVWTWRPVRNRKNKSK